MVESISRTHLHRMRGDIPGAVVSGFILGVGGGGKVQVEVLPQFHGFTVRWSASGTGMTVARKILFVNFHVDFADLLQASCPEEMAFRLGVRFAEKACMELGLTPQSIQEGTDVIQQS